MSVFVPVYNAVVDCIRTEAVTSPGTAGVNTTVMTESGAGSGQGQGHDEDRGQSPDPSSGYRSGFGSVINHGHSQDRGQ